MSDSSPTSVKSAAVSHHFRNARRRSTGAAVMMTATSSGFTPASSACRSSTCRSVLSARPVTVSARKLTSFSHTTRRPPNSEIVCTASRNRFIAASTSATLLAKPFSTSRENSSATSPASAA